MNTYWSFCLVLHLRMFLATSQLPVLFTWLICPCSAGGLTRLQRVYGEGEATRLGNDWAGGAKDPKECSCQQDHAAAASGNDQQPPETRGTSWLQQLMVWWRRHSTSTAAWLPASDIAATQADFAVGDEAQHDRKSAPTTATAIEADAQQVWDDYAAASMYRKLLTWKAFGGGTTDAAQPAIKGLPRSHHSAGCKCRSSAFAELQYNVYSLQDYDPVWEHYAYIYPVWVGDFGKNNMSASINMSAVAKVSGCWCCRQRKHL